MTSAINAGNARAVLDELLSMLADQGCDEETTFGVHLAVDEMLMKSIARQHSGG